MILVDVDQRTEAWHAARLGRLTASVAGDMMARIKSGEAASRRELRTRLVCERLTGRPQEDVYVSKDMQRGIDLEPAARAAYESLTGYVVHPVGFVQHDTLAAGGSPDGQIGQFTGLVELKCPRSGTHLSYWRGGGVPADYRWQLVHLLWLTSAQWVDFVSYDDRFPLPLQVFVVRMVRDATELDAYELMVRDFLGGVDRELTLVEGLMTRAA